MSGTFSRRRQFATAARRSSGGGIAVAPSFGQWEKMPGSVTDPQEARLTFTRITSNPDQLGGMPCIRGLRIPVATVVGMFADGMTEVEILNAYPDLVQDDISEALRYAAEGRL
jgi:uncharacterized protein (DUF433 family)